MAKKSPLGACIKKTRAMISSPAWENAFPDAAVDRLDRNSKPRSSVPKDKRAEAYKDNLINNINNIIELTKQELLRIEGFVPEGPQQEQPTQPPTQPQNAQAQQTTQEGQGQEAQGEQQTQAEETPEQQILNQRQPNIGLNESIRLSAERDALDLPPSQAKAPPAAVAQISRYSELKDGPIKRLSKIKPKTGIEARFINLLNRMVLRTTRPSTSPFSSLRSQSPDIAGYYVDMLNEYVDWKAGKGPRPDRSFQDNLPTLQWFVDEALKAQYKELVANYSKINPDIGNKVSFERFADNPKALRDEVIKSVAKNEVDDSRRNKERSILMVRLQDAINKFKSEINRDDFIKRGGKANQQRAGLIYDGVVALDATQITGNSLLKKYIHNIDDAIVDESYVPSAELFAIDRQVADFSEEVANANIAGMARDPFGPFGRMFGRGLASVPTNLDQFSKFKEFNDFITDRLYGPAQIDNNKAVGEENSFLKWYNDKRKEIGRLSADKLNLMGVIANIQQYRLGQNPAQALKHRIGKMRESFKRIRDKYIDSPNPSRKMAVDMMDILDKLESSINFEQDVVPQFNHQVGSLLSDSELKIMDETINRFGDTFRDDIRFVTQSVYGDPFIEHSNYMMDFQVLIDDTAKRDQANIDDPIDKILDLANPFFSDSPNVARQAPTIERTDQLGGGRVFVTNFDAMVKGAVKRAAFEKHTAYSRKLLARKLADGGAFATAINTTTTGQEVKRSSRMTEMRKILRDQVYNEVYRNSPETAVTRLLNDTIQLVGSAALASFKHWFLQPMTAWAHYLAENAGRPNAMRFLMESHKVFTDPKLRTFIQENAAPIAWRATDGEPALDARATLADAHKSDLVLNVRNSLEKIKNANTYFLKKGDRGAAYSVFVSEFALQEADRIRRTTGREIDSFDDIDWDHPNAQSLIRAQVKSEHNFNTSRTSSKGSFLQNNNNISVVRNLLVAFRSHSFNLGTRAQLDFRNIIEHGGDLSRPEVRNAIRELAGIVAQSATYGYVSFKVAMIASSIALSFIKDAEKGEEDDEYLALLERREAIKDLPQGPIRQALLENLNKDISYVETLRNILSDEKRKRESGRATLGRVLSDTGSNLFTPFVFAETVGATKAVFGWVDGADKDTFEKEKNQQKADLQASIKTAESLGMDRLVASLRKRNNALDDIEYIPLSPSSFYRTPVGGTLGMGAEFGLQGLDIVEGVMGLDEFSGNDILLWLSAISPIPPEIDQYMRLVNKIQKAEFDKLKREELKAE